MLKYKPQPGEWTCSECIGGDDDEQGKGVMSIPSHARLSVTALYRKKILLEIVQEKKIVECGNVFFAEYQTRLNAATGESQGMLFV